MAAATRPAAAPGAWAQRLLTQASAPRDAAGLAAFRVLFGALACFASLRFLANGWVERFFVQPDFYFTYWGFAWVQALPPPWMHAVFWALAALGLMIAVGLLYRAATVAFFILFTYVELIDVTNYLNHYYLVSLLGLLLAVLPLHRAWSLDALLRPAIATRALPAYMTWLLRCQVGVVYVYAGLAKLGADWLLHAQPLNIWLSSRVETPLLGPHLDAWWVALAMSWAGFLFDTTIVAFLLWRRTRAAAYAVVLCFHLGTHMLFTIGLFPLLMVSFATIFFDPSWPRRLLPPRWRQPPDLRAARAAARAAAPPPGPGRRVAMAAAALWCVVQVLVPLRCHVLYDGPVTWHEQGMRWAWKVMVREKNGSVTYHVRLPDEGRTRLVTPSRYLTSHQEREMSGQPDLILQLAHRIGADFEARGHRRVEVRVEALVSLNGRPARLLIDPDVDLMQTRDSLAPADWIMPAPSEPPIRLRPLRLP